MDYTTQVTEYFSMGYAIIKQINLLNAFAGYSNSIREDWIKLKNLVTAKRGKCLRRT